MINKIWKQARQHRTIYTKIQHGAPPILVQIVENRFFKAFQNSINSIKPLGSLGSQKRHAFRILTNGTVYLKIFVAAKQKLR